MDFEKIATAMPINKTAGIVVSQKNCQTTLTLKQEHENVKLAITKLQKTMLTLPKKSLKRKELGWKLEELKKLSSELKKKLHANKTRSLENILIDELKKEVSVSCFNRAKKRAYEKYYSESL